MGARPLCPQSLAFPIKPYGLQSEVSNEHLFISTHCVPGNVQGPEGNAEDIGSLAPVFPGVVEGTLGHLCQSLLWVQYLPSVTSHTG